MYKTHAVNKNR